MPGIENMRPSDDRQHFPKDLEPAGEEYRQIQGSLDHHQNVKLHHLPIKWSPDRSEEQQTIDSVKSTETRDGYILISHASQEEVPETKDTREPQRLQGAKFDQLTPIESGSSNSLGVTGSEPFTSTSLGEMTWKRRITITPFSPLIKEGKVGTDYGENHLIKRNFAQVDLLSYESSFRLLQTEDLLKLQNSKCDHTHECREVPKGTCLWQVLRQLQVMLPTQSIEESVKAFWRKVPTQPGSSESFCNVPEQASIPPITARYHVEGPLKNSKTPHMSLDDKRLEILHLSAQSSVETVHEYRRQKLFLTCNHNENPSERNLKVGPWKCWNCNIDTFRDFTSWKQHMEQRDPKNIFVCPICSETKHAKDLLLNHLFLYHYAAIDKMQIITMDCIVQNDLPRNRQCGYCDKILQTWEEFYLHHIPGHFLGNIPYKRSTWHVPYLTKDDRAGGCSADASQVTNLPSNPNSSETVGDRTGLPNTPVVHNKAHESTFPGLEILEASFLVVDGDATTSLANNNMERIKARTPRKDGLLNLEKAESMRKEPMKNRLPQLRETDVDDGTSSGDELAKKLRDGPRIFKTPGNLPSLGQLDPSCPFLAREPYYREVFMQGGLFYHSVKKIWASRKSIIDLVSEHATNQIYARKTLRDGGEVVQLKIEHEREVKIMRLLSEFQVPHTTRLKSWSTDGYSLVMYPVAECSLRQYLEKPRQSYRGDLTKWVGCLASAVNFLHSPQVNVTHGDIKPANILIQGSDIFLSDFGESKVEIQGENKPYTGGRFTVMYSAPEVLEQGIRSKSTDIWALGCVFAEMFTVLCNRSYQNYHKMLNTCSKAFTEFPAHKVRLRAILTWIQDFDSCCTTAQHSRQSGTYAPSTSIAKMLQPYPENRIDARQVLQLFPHNLACCSGDTIPQASGKMTSKAKDGGKPENLADINQDDPKSGPRVALCVPTNKSRYKEEHNSAREIGKTFRTAFPALDQVDIGTELLAKTLSCPVKTRGVEFPSRSKVKNSLAMSNGPSRLLQIPAGAATNAANEAISQPSKGRKRERSTSSASTPPGGKSCAPPEKCQVRIGLKERESQEKGTQPPSRRIVLQVSKQTRDHIVQALSGPGMSYFIPLMLTPKYS